eukprot:CAMPEP_0174370766 /NCGR_PEP_ID=MMETSP0811_2-20130205/97231_1 /TAXON_ID=73025 ORGANISM="Eutreptiella gymnastica-like, Strain CCMP1594" /NCGR_SAMPLE_ID=MMETSP0811_2 /ASSEMBLY_ACC=CAM_ASM_000667 /LENGTH=93 /DNA_ID=CAMNT_0015516485 /DNA_START=530 /DNA_END=808 /DNA_ORIENTATION=-
MQQGGRQGGKRKEEHPAAVLLEHSQCMSTAEHPLKPNPIGPVQSDGTSACNPPIAQRMHKGQDTAGEWCPSLDPRGEVNAVAGALDLLETDYW